MPQIFLNNFQAALTVAINTTDTQLHITNMGLLTPMLEADGYYMLTLVEGETVEIVYAVFASLSDTFLTITRAMEGTVAASFTAAAVASVNMTAWGTDHGNRIINPFIPSAMRSIDHAQKFIYSNMFEVVGETPASNYINIPFPADHYFFVEEVGIYCNFFSPSITGSLVLAFGSTALGDTAIVGNTTITQQTQGSRQRITALQTDIDKTGLNDLTVKLVSAPAGAGTWQIRVYAVGNFIADV